MKPDKSNHVVTVDFARGAMAVSVMLYHLLSWESVVAVERIAYYAVYGFFIVSGFSLYVAYRDRLENSKDMRAFFTRRFFRIAPLFYTALMLHWWIRGIPLKDFYFLITNVTFTFGLTNPGETSILAGGWSIGVEMFFYLVFPIIVVCCAKRIRVLSLVTAIAVVLQIMFVNHVLTGYDTMIGVWPAYTQPVSFAGYFLFGCLIGEFYTRCPDLKGSLWATALAVVTIVVFSVIPVNAPTELLKGITGIILASACGLFVAAVAFVREPVGRLRSLAVWLGSLSYPIYLLHPLVQAKVSDLHVPTSTLRILLTIAATICVSHIISKLIETPLRDYGRRVATAA